MAPTKEKTTAEISVKRTSGILWWVWLTGLLVIIAGLWFWFARGERDRVVGTSSVPAAAAPASSVAVAPAETVRSAAAPAATTAGAASPAAVDLAASGAAVSDFAIYGATADKLSLARRGGALSGVKVVRIVGPKTLTIASGSDELFRDDRP